MRKIIAAAAVMLALMSCEEEVNLDQYRGEPTVVVNCVANSDTTVMASVSKTWFFTDTKPADDIEGLDLRLAVNDRPATSMEFSDGMYRSDVRPQPGDRLTLHTVVDGKEVSAQSTMPQGVEIKRVEVSQHKIPGLGSSWSDGWGNVKQYDYDLSYTYRITFSDPDLHSKFYYLRIDAANRMAERGTINYSYDPLFQAAAQEVNISIASLQQRSYFGFPFSGAAADPDDTTYTLTVAEEGAAFNYEDPEHCGRVVTIYSISEDYYRYIVTLMSNNDATWHGEMTAKGLAEPVKIHSNIQGGTGILACATPVASMVVLPVHQK